MRHFPLNLWSIPVVVLSVLFFAGCAEMNQQGLTAKVSLADIQILEVRSLETAFQVDLRVINPNDTALIVHGVDCDLEVDNNHFASGVSGESHEIPPYGSTIIPVTVYASMFDVVPSVIRIVQGRSNQQNQAPLHYELAGHIRASSGSTMKKKLPFQSKGELTFGGNR